MKGKRIGTGEPNSSQDRITRETLRRLGLNADRDVTLVPFGSRSVLRVNALFANKPGLKGKRAEDLTDGDLIGELERDGFFKRLYNIPPEHGE